MFTAALEHLRTGEGRKLCSTKGGKKRTELRNFMSTECLYAKHVQ